MKRNAKIVLLIAMVLCVTALFVACNKNEKPAGYQLPATQFNQTYVALDSSQANTALTAIKSTAGSVMPYGENYKIFGTMTASGAGYSVETLLDAIIGVDAENKTVLSGYSETKTMGIQSKGYVYVKDNKMYTNVSAMGNTAKFYTDFTDSETSPYSAQMFDGYLGMITKLENLDGVTVSKAESNGVTHYKFNFDESFIPLSASHCVIAVFNDFSVYVTMDGDRVTGMKVSIDYSFKFTDEYINSLSEEAATYLKGNFPVITNLEIAKTETAPTFPDDLDTYPSEKEFSESYDE